MNTVEKNSLSGVLISRLADTVLIIWFVGLVYFAYYHLNLVGFYLDDYSSIINNPALQVPIDYVTIAKKHFSRMLSYTLLAFQNELFQGQAAGFHFVGLLFHIAVCCLVYALAKQLFLLTHFKHPSYLAIAASIVFAIHPQNSQTVVYVVQQTTIFIALFYLLALFAYIKLRISTKKYHQWLFFLLLIITSLCALFSKQNAVTLPLAFLLLEWCFFQKHTRTLLIGYSLGGILLLSIFSWVKSFDLVQLMAFIDKASIENTLIGRDAYFYTQLQVVYNYLLQFIYPINFKLEYDTELITEFSQVDKLFVMVHLFLIAVALSFKKKLPVITFGLLFYYLALAIESTIIPITDLAFEHRTYLPNVGLVIALFAVLAWVTNKASAAKVTDTKLMPSRVLISHKLIIIFMLSFIILCGFLSYLTHSRVAMWADQKSFYQNEIKLSPKSPRAYTELANIYSEAGDCPLAIGMSEHAITLYEKQRQSSLGAQPEFYQNYIGCLRQLKILDKADYFEKYLLVHVNEPIRRAAILFQRGTFMLLQHDFTQAEEHLTKSIKLNGKNHATAINLAITKVQLGKTVHAVKLLQHALALKPNDQLIKEMLVNVQATLNQ